MRLFTLLFCLSGLLNSLTAQTSTGFWSPVNPTEIQLTDQAAPAFQPQHFRAYQLQYADWAQTLTSAPLEFTAAAKNKPLLVQLPLADGSFKEFRVWESPVMAPELTAKYPAIRTYAGTATDGSETTVRMGVGYQGYNAFIFEKNGAIQSIRPYANGQTRYYMAYRLADLPREAELTDGIRCGVDDHENILEQLEQVQGQQKPVVDRGGSAPITLKTYRIAIAAKGEYTVFHGGSKAQALSAINTALNFITAITDRDFGLRYQLIANNDAIIFLDPNTDPYTGNTVGDWMNQNPAAIDSIIPNSSYDVGHVFSRYSTGNQVGVVSGRACNDQTKARGASSAQSPNAEYFFLVAAHEFCHQLSGGHSWSNCPGNEGQLAAGTAFEPGSGSTIMSYAGSCGMNNNVQGDNDPYFHIGNIIQVQNFMWQGSGNTCGGTIASVNNAPTVSITSPKNVIIPINTPFRLTAAGTDPDGNTLSYCWEQYDTDPNTYQLGAPGANAPAFRSFSPGASPTRYFPNLPDLAANMTTPVEVLPTYDRTLTFRVAVRDNNSNGGGQAWDEIKISPRTTAGPFRVTYPDVAGITWQQGEYQIITWDVANTNQMPVNSKRVNIKLSTNGGITYPMTLASNVLNQGRYCIKVPPVTSSAVRIMVESADNVFFDISNNNINVQAPTQSDYSLCSPGIYDTICLPGQYSTSISTAATLGFSNPINLSVSGLPLGATAVITPNPVVPGSDAVLAFTFPANQTETILNYTVKGDAGGNLDSTTNSLWVFLNDYTNLSLKTPANGAAGQFRSPILRWNDVPGVQIFEIQVATSPSFAAGSIVFSKNDITADSIELPIQLGEGAVYYWRLRPMNACGTGNWVGPYSFSTVVNICSVFTATDLPKVINPNLVSTVESKITLPSGGSVTDVNIKKIQVTHAFFKDLEMHLIGPGGTDVQLFKNKCGGNSGNFNFGFDDTSPSPFACPPSTNGLIYQPEVNLSAFNSKAVGGDWILRVSDNVISSGGSLTAFELEVCSSTALNPPVLVNNKTLQVMPGANAAITTGLLKTEDSNNSDDELLYTLVSLPKHGHLELNWTGQMPVGAQFTQADLNNNGLGYFNYGGLATSDQFCFTVTDGEGGLIADCFNIQPFPVSAGESRRAIDFLLSPNPAGETVRIAFGETQAPNTRIRLFDIAGRLISTEKLAATQQVLQINVAYFPKGIYTVVVDNAEGSGVRKLVLR